MGPTNNEQTAKQLNHQTTTRTFRFFVSFELVPGNATKFHNAPKMFPFRGPAWPGPHHHLGRFLGAEYTLTKSNSQLQRIFETATPRTLDNNIVGWMHWKKYVLFACINDTPKWSLSNWIILNTFYLFNVLKNHLNPPLFSLCTFVVVLSCYHKCCRSKVECCLVALLLLLLPVSLSVDGLIRVSQSLGSPHSHWGGAETSKRI